MYRLVCPVLFGSSARAWREACRRPAWRRRKHCCQSSVRAWSEPKRQRQGEECHKVHQTSSAGPAFRARGACGVEKTVARAREHQPSGGGQVLRNDSANLPASGWLVVFVLRCTRVWASGRSGESGSPPPTRRSWSSGVVICPPSARRPRRGTAEGRAGQPFCAVVASEISSAIDRACCHVGAELSGINSALSSVRALRRLWAEQRHVRLRGMPCSR